jgi:hypothetical protein
MSALPQWQTFNHPTARVLQGELTAEIGKRQGAMNDRNWIQFAGSRLPSTQMMTS